MQTPREHLKWPSTISRVTAHFVSGLVSDLVICKLKEHGVIYDTESPYWDQALLNIIKLKLVGV